MIRLIDFIKAIHDAILAADEVLMRKNLELLDTFFEDAEDDPAIQTVLDDALAATRGVLEQDGRPGKEGLRNAQRAIEELAKALPPGSASRRVFEWPRNSHEKQASEDGYHSVSRADLGRRGDEQRSRSAHHAGATLHDTGFRSQAPLEDEA